MKLFKRNTGTIVLFFLAGFVFLALGRTCNAQYKNVSPSPPVKAVTSGPKHHFFGYYGICPWSASERYILCLETAFQDRTPYSGDMAKIRLVDLETGDLVPVGETFAWNFQQGAMLHWLPTSSDSLIIYNHRRGRKFISVITNIYTDESRVLPRAISGLSNDGKHALSLNLRRIEDMRPGLGINTGNWAGTIVTLNPKDDGLFIMNLEDDSYKLIVSYDRVNSLVPRPLESTRKPMWFNLPIFNTDDSRIFFITRVPQRKKRGWYTASFTVNPDGSDLRCILPYEWGASHIDWKSPDEILVTTFFKGAKNISYILFTDGKQDYRVIGEGVLTRDGHGSFSPDGRWMVSDTYPNEENNKSLLLINMETEEVLQLGEFSTSAKLRGGPLRCDLHPRWNHDGTKICFDSVHEGTRQVYIMDVSEIVGK